MALLTFHAKLGMPGQLEQKEHHQQTESHHRRNHHHGIDLERKQGCDDLAKPLPAFR